MTTPPNERRTDVRAWVLGLVVLLASGLLGARYFTFGDTRQQIDKQWKEFYPRLRPGWAELKPSEIDYAFDNNPDLWMTLVVRTAYDRWRLRSLAPEPFDRIMNDYARGWWLSPKRSVWEEKFKTYDARWMEARRKALADGEALKKHLSVQVARPDPNALLLRFPGRPHTCEVGSRVRLVVDSPPEGVPNGPVLLYWETEKATGPAAHRRRLATCEPVDGAPPGFQRLQIESDLSWEPVWMFSGSVVRGLWYRSTKAAEWKIAGLYFADSPLLPLPQASGSSSP